jgi:hypothetical protein
VGGGFQREAAGFGALRGGLEHFLEEAEIEAGAFEEAVEDAVGKIVGEGGGRVGLGVVGTAEVDHHAHGRGREKLVHVPARVGDGFEDEDRFEEEVGLVAAEKAEGGGAGFRVDEKVDRVLHEGVIGGEETDVFADDGAGAVEGGEHAVGRNRREGFDVGVARVEEEVALLVVFQAHAEVIEQVGKKGAEKRIGIGGADALDHARGDGGIERVELQQAVAAPASFSTRARGGIRRSRR